MQFSAEPGGKGSVQTQEQAEVFPALLPALPSSQMAKSHRLVLVSSCLLLLASFGAAQTACTAATPW